jgi:hypothetical protein
MSSVAAAIPQLDYKKEFLIFQSNVNRMARAYYYDLAIYDAAKGNQQTVCVLNSNGWFWDDFRKYTVMSVFILLGCVFDKDERSHSITRLLEAAKSSTYFTKEELRLRKIACSENSSEWIDGYMKNVQDLSSDDFDQISNFIKMIEGDWEKMKTVRHKFFAHQDVFTDENIKKQTLEAADNELIKSIIDRLLVVENILLEAGSNGRKPDFSFNPLQMVGIAKDEINKVINSLSKGYSS